VTKQASLPPEGFVEDGIKYVPYRTLPAGDTLEPGEKLRGNCVYKPEASPLDPTSDRKTTKTPPLVMPIMKSLTQRREEIKSRPVGEDLINDWMPTSATLMLLAGRPGIGKTFVLLDLLCCLASGTPFLSHKCKPVKVGLLSLEGDEIKLLRRIDTLIAESYPKAEASFGWTHTIPIKLTTPKGRAWLCNQFEGKDIVGIDTLTKLCGGDINSPKDVAAFLSILKEVMTETGTSVIATHHCRKPDKRIKILPSDLIFEIRGAIDFVAEAQSVLLLEKAKQGRGELGKFENLEGKRILYTAKLKDSPTDEAGIELLFNDTKLRYLPVVEDYEKPFQEGVNGDG